MFFVGLVFGPCDRKKVKASGYLGFTLSFAQAHLQTLGDLGLRPACSKLAIQHMFNVQSRLVTSLTYFC